MYKIDPAQNRIAPLEAKRFGELGFSERKHLQVWRIPTTKPSAARPAAAVHSLALAP